MNESSKANLEEALNEGKYIRKVRSFVKREGRLTKGQAAAIEKCWSSMGLEHSQGLLDFSQVFGNDNDVVLEIGFGMGKSLVEMAKNAPHLNFIGIEVHRPGVGACLMEADEAGLTNLRVFEHDAVEVLADCIADGSLTTMQLFFPDPWHKKRHHKRRIVQPEFVESLRQKLRVGGVFHMATDWENYAEHMLEVMTAAPGYENISETQDYVPRPDNRPLTKFEQRGHRLGHGVWDLMFKRSN
ncbi:tRNA (guanosine(46)-N7)-methyltransferase TrmB [Pseudoalteromonas phenolica]|uniref:tRNA (guanine-N(7)-)-methyltransferase n=1 Tax=Pseudoalteromonas phenolica TaxID=161398 RepID=A0A0S2K530_9GAMM|nr:tRNA (guanosine(46)-N7)-methyltransferase TrmB [Pseudoalteromonas phenolica]ALO43240.1 tRNA (guanine-N(7)-)-methyltransferase [Pseudoalteromonas phenolica]MBE0355604.1 tRNA (guanine-N7-)-methyltransferase [Pseudoalteromonas phenolica O-BC30]RXF05858.1 tRNA (guanosine(46)-N7)-methyltransferase TrmB [Pseudoalteromonas phenolica O-BC30]TMO56159.1 tRNA (guanosine(46)-N7)-methyltransferase TrmB [Pseudoalteromonas phenolica]